jgi:uncharacterized protein DUF4265
MVKIWFRDSSSHATETLWATPVEGGFFQLDNSPFLAYGVSWRDVIEARPDGQGCLEFVRCVRKSGNRTLRIIFRHCSITDSEANIIFEKLRKLGCSYEGMQPKLVSINVPIEVELTIVTDFLNGTSTVQWEYADPTYSDVKNRLN